MREQSRKGLRITAGTSVKAPLFISRDSEAQKKGKAGWHLVASERVGHGKGFLSSPPLTPHTSDFLGSCLSKGENMQKLIHLQVFGDCVP